MLPAKTSSSSSRHTYSRTTHLEFAVSCCWGTWKRTSKKHKKMKHNVMAVTLGQGCQLEWGMVSCKLYKIFGNDEILFHLGKNEKKARNSIHEYESRSWKCVCCGAESCLTASRASCFSNRVEVPFLSIR